MSNDKTISISGGAELPPDFGGSCLVLIYGGDLGECTPIKSEVTIGRAESNQVVVYRPDVSRRHLRVFRQGLACFVEDLGSTNGTYLNETRILEPTPLGSGDLLRAGRVVFKYLDGNDVEALYHEEIYRMTITDGLTRLYNKRYLEQFLEREISRSLRHQHPLSLAMFDIDGFKKVNDTHGHPAGDRILRGIAETVGDDTRTENLFARYGGDEFVLVMIETQLDAAERCCERIQGRIRELTVEEDGAEVRITISGGIATLIGRMEPDELIRHADRALYQAKLEGGDRIAVDRDRQGGDS